MYFNVNHLSSFAFRCGCSFIGGRPFTGVLTGKLGEIVFFFKPHHYGNKFFKWIKQNFNSREYDERILIWKGQQYYSVFLTIQPKIDKKFLLSFRNFINKSTHLVNYF